jgi:NAD(P)-dependent dehydrogenase (short-subunit alcohol dehydrogenase family)
VSGPLTDRLALVTGASRGIGAATAEALAKAGAHVILTARTEGGLTEVEDRIHAAGGTATIAPLDLMDGEAIGRLADAVGGRWGRLDMLVLNAGTLGDLMPVNHQKAKDFARIIGVNLIANQQMIAAFDPLLRLSGAGSVLALTSGVALRPRAYWGAYAASKSALEVLIQTYAAEVANIGTVKAAIVDPGPTRTAMRAKAFPGEDPDTLKGPEVVAAAILEALTAGFTNGERITAS